MLTKILIDNVKRSLIEHVRQIAMGVTKREEKRKDNIKGKTGHPAFLSLIPSPIFYCYVIFWPGLGLVPSKFNSLPVGESGA